MSELTQSMIINVVVLLAVLHGDLGRHRKIGPWRIVRPLLTACAIVPLFISRPVTHGNGLTVEIVGVAAGLVGGLLALALMGVYRSPQTGRPASRATAPYAMLWIVIIAARACFSYGADHWFPSQLDHWAFAHQVTGAAITDGLIFMAIAMVVVRTVGLAARAALLPEGVNQGGVVASARV